VASPPRWSRTRATIGAIRSPRDRESDRRGARRTPSTPTPGGGLAHGADRPHERPFCPTPSDDTTPSPHRRTPSVQTEPRIRKDCFRNCKVPFSPKDEIMFPGLLNPPAIRAVNGVLGFGDEIFDWRSADGLEIGLILCRKWACTRSRSIGPTVSAPMVSWPRRRSGMTIAPRGPISFIHGSETRARELYRHSAPRRLPTAFAQPRVTRARATPRESCGRAGTIPRPRSPVAPLTPQGSQLGRRGPTSLSPGRVRLHPKRVASPFSTRAWRAAL